MAIRALKTFYDRHEFRSRLEARWAVLLNVMGLPCWYEPQDFALPGVGGYLPDFASRSAWVLLSRVCSTGRFGSAPLALLSAASSAYVWRGAICHPSGS
jgi:hypothetical protein